MPKGPNGQKRPADAIGLAVMVGRIATGEVEETAADPASAQRSERGKKGGSARATRMTTDERSEAAKLAAAARWRRKVD